MVRAVCGVGFGTRHGWQVGLASVVCGFWRLLVGVKIWLSLV